MINVGRASKFKAAVSSLGIPKSYQRLGAFPLDDSTVFATIDERNAMVEGVRYVGMMAYVEESNCLYLLKGGITNDCWKPLTTTDDLTEGVTSYTAKNSAIVKGQIVRLIDSSFVEPADVNNKYQCVIGIALNNAEIGESVSVQVSGEAIVKDGKVLEVGKNCFLGEQGDIVQTLNSSPLMLSVGVAIDTNKILIYIDNEVIMFE